MRSKWLIAGLMTAAIAISYFDRQTLPVAIKAIGHDIPISDVAFSRLQAAFLLSYAAFYAIAGALIDKLGVRIGFALVMGFWSIACALHGFATGLGFLMVARFLLGAGEGGGFPTATRATAEWFAPEERSTAMGLINAGTAVGSVIAPPLIAIVLLRANWRWMFFFSGLAGLVWCVAWLLAYKDSMRPKFKPAADQRVYWASLLGMRQVWGLVIAKFLSDAAWYFYLFWLPKYLYDSRGFDIQHIGSLAWIPYAASGVGSLTGGWLSSWMVRRYGSVNLARKVTLLASACLMPFVLFITNSNLTVALGLFSLAFFGQQWWSTLVMVLPADLFPPNLVGSVAGLTGMGGALGGMIFGLIVGQLLSHGFGYSSVFASVAFLHLVAFGVITLLVGKITPIPTPATYLHTAHT